MHIGDVATTGAPCPGSPGCPGYIDPATNAAIQAAIAQLPVDQAQTPAPSLQPAQWFSGVSNSTVVLVGAIIGGALLLGSRR